MESEFEIVVSPNHPAFAGHFPGQPIVPGVLLLDWVLVAIEEREARTLLPGELSVAKFLNPVAPGAVLNVRYRFADNAARSLNVHIECERQLVATATFAVERSV